ncbi:MAG: glutamyl-tRNA reductase [Chloroflexi bacterium]|nr:glutamyl-tRNA reductase [Chloroflexota bacterium]
MSDTATDMKPRAIPVLVIGINHKLAPVEVRERLAFGPERIPSILRELADDGNSGRRLIKEAVLLSTCNRTEIYIHADNSVDAEFRLQKFFVEHAGLSVEQLRDMEYIIRGVDAAHHLMRVSAGLDSLILGESEILGQVRSASETAQAAGTNGPILSALFRYAIQAGKHVHAETSIGLGNISVASAAVELAEQVFGPLKDRTALLIGAGKISSITAKALVKAGLHCVMIANRTYERAQKLAKSLNGIAVRFDALDETLAQADIVICSTGAPHVILHADTVSKAQQARHDRPLLIADLAMPRDVDSQVVSIPGVRLINIDDLGNIVKTCHALTASVYQAAEKIVRRELEDFCDWWAARRCAPLIEALHQKAETIYQTEVAQTLRRLGPLTPHQQLLVQALGKSIAGKLLHDPTTCLRELPKEQDISTYVEVVQHLYDIQ